MPLHAGTHLGPYEILAALGAGGMGEVYRARDTKLGRDVALKVLPDAFAADPDRVARFKREAQLLASLNHPHIAAIYGLEESADVRALVMELVEGPTLADLIVARQPTPVGVMPERSGARTSASGGGAPRGLEINDVLAIARQIADALEAAHEQGIVHRDLKPANVKVRADGTVKVLDFGLAKAVEQASGVGLQAAELTNSPTITSPAMTMGGVILGTAAYMSPEQAAGKPVDKRSDLWAFGVLLFEMLTGRQLFTGETASHILAEVLKSEPDWSALPATTPPSIRKLLRRCLEKERKRRLADAADARLEIDEAMAAPPADPTSAAQETPRSGWRRSLVVAAAGVAAGIALTALLGRREWAPETPTTAFATRFALPVLTSVALSADRAVTVSPDGSRIVYVTTGNVLASGLMSRRLDQLEPEPIRGVTDPRSPFISPDGRWVGFFDRGELKKVLLSGGSPVTICRIGTAFRGGTWGADGTIVFGTSDPNRGLLSVAAGGGEPHVLTTPDQSRGEGAHTFPSLLPGGRAVLFTVTRQNRSDSSNNDIAVLDLATGRSKILVNGGSSAQYVTSGHLLYVAGDALNAVRFDLASLAVVGDPAVVVPGVAARDFGAADYAVSSNGTLVYLSAASNGPQAAARSLVWLDRQGHETPTDLALKFYTVVRISPDGTRAALDERDARGSRIWVWDIAHRTLTGLDAEHHEDNNPVWAPDGRHIFFWSSRNGRPQVFSRAADGSGQAQQVSDSPNNPIPKAASPDGRSVIVQEVVAASGTDLNLVRLGGEPRYQPLIAAPGSQNNPSISPDGRWLAYQSDESGDREIYVRPFPNVDEGRWQVSTTGGFQAGWARSGKELFYVDPTGAMMVAAVHTGSTFSAEKPRKLFETHGLFSAGAWSWDVMPDAQRFLAIRGLASAVRPQGNIVVVENWLEELKRKVPTR